MRKIRFYFNFLVSIVLIVWVSQSQASILFEEDWLDDTFVAGMTITPFGGASFISSGGFLTVTPGGTNSGVDIILPDNVTQLFFSEIIPGDVFGNPASLEIFTGDYEMVLYEEFVEASPKIKTIKDKQKKIVASIIYSGAVAETFIALPDNKIKVITALIPESIELEHIVDNSSPPPPAPPKPFKRFRLKPGNSGIMLASLSGAPVPEPSTFFLFGLGAVVLIGFSRKLQKIKE